ncbi:ParA family protein [Desulfobacter hydrogenophilus]|uniref:ParA family protein n=1 Tax=Desulfobacter hydrogenophilus TaxID=2291 RepID=A0A328FAS9_9BACT|nr:ParA family protein [Desulfobacter hydrogenophilus]NDY72093.1 ParA family protein [Desulfobacter hydrogenophilus]QBH14818.1 ParA family protein [Desulfobacter hydrogenophilus]RAM01326.1 ParA family protein [Desulfobacter hydrogenophilus]
MRNVLTISGLKGGTGKSVTALNLSASVALYGKKVLLVDCDPQACVSQWRKIDSNGNDHDLAQVLAGKISVPEAVSGTDIDGLYILPAGFDLFSISLKLTRRIDNEKLLRLVIDEIRHDYDIIILDAPSSCGYLSLAALTAADWLAAVVTPNNDWVSDFYSLMRIVRYIRRSHNIPLGVAGILFNRCNSEKQMENCSVPEVLEQIRPLIYKTMIPDDEILNKKQASLSPLSLYDIKAQASQAYLGIAREIICAFNLK